VNAFVLTYNKQTWDWDTAEHPRAQFVRDTWSKSVVSGRWSTGNRTGGLQPGDTGYLFRQGTGLRGLIGAGQFTSEIYTAPHFTNPRRFAHYADIDWSDVLSDDQVLPLDDARQAATGASWAHMQGSGVLLSEADAAALERLWQRHLVDLGRAGRSASAGWEQDTARRQAVEDHAQDLLMRYYEDQGYRVHDTRRGHPYDAVAVKQEQTLYLEAKGTTGDGGTVLVTAGEVDFARAHPGQAVIGIVSGVRFDDDGLLDKDSGWLVRHAWNPDDGELVPTAYTWRPGAGGGDGRC